MLQFISSFAWVAAFGSWQLQFSAFLVQHSRQLGFAVYFLQLLCNSAVFLPFILLAYFSFYWVSEVSGLGKSLLIFFCRISYSSSFHFLQIPCAQFLQFCSCRQLCLTFFSVFFCFCLPICYGITCSLRWPQCLSHVLCFYVPFVLAFFFVLFYLF